MKVLKEYNTPESFFKNVKNFKKFNLKNDWKISVKRLKGNLIQERNENIYTFFKRKRI